MNILDTASEDSNSTSQIPQVKIHDHPLFFPPLSHLFSSIDQECFYVTDVRGNPNSLGHGIASLDSKPMSLTTSSFSPSIHMYNLRLTKKEHDAVLLRALFKSTNQPLPTYYTVMYLHGPSHRASAVTVTSVAFAAELCKRANNGTLIHLELSWYSESLSHICFCVSFECLFRNSKHS